MRYPVGCAKDPDLDVPAAWNVLSCWVALDAARSPLAKPQILQVAKPRPKAADRCCTPTTLKSCLVAA